MAAIARPVGVGRGRRLHLSIGRSLLARGGRHRKDCSWGMVLKDMVLHGSSLRELRQLRDRGILAGSL